MSARSSLALAAATLGLVLASSCTFTRTSVDSCTQNSDCRDAFGVGRICGGDGFCAAAPVNPRCATTFPEDIFTHPEAYPGVLLVGSLADESVASQGARENAVRLAVSQVNQNNGVDKRLFGVVFCNIAADPKFDALARTDAAVASARYLADVVGVSAIVGPSSSTDALAVYDNLDGVKKIGAGADVLVISPAATSPQLTGYDNTNGMPPSDQNPGLLWRTAPPDTLQGAAIVSEIVTAYPTVTSVVVIEEKGSYGDALTQVFTQGFQTGGRTVMTFPFSNANERDAAVVTAGETGAPIVLFISSQSTDGIAFLNAAGGEAGYAKTTLFLTDTEANTDLLNGTAAVSALYPRVVGSRPAVPSGNTYNLFQASFRSAYAVDPNTFSFVPHSYDAAWLAFYGTARALRVEKKITGTGIARGLRSISNGTPNPIPVAPANWESIIDTLGTGGTVNVVGASGNLDYDPTTEETAGLVDIWKISADGKSIITDTTIDPTK